MPETTRTGGGTPRKAPYAPPTVTPLNEEEILKVFQFTSASVSWWVSGQTGSM